MPRLTEGWSSDQEPTLNAAVRRQVEARPDQLFLDFSGETFTYGSFDTAVTRLANALMRLGAGPGSNVSTMLDNNADAVLLWFAICRIGATWVPINTAFKGLFLKHQLNDSGASLVIAETDYAERIVAVADDLPSLRMLLHRGDPPQGTAVSLTILPLDDHRDGGTSAIDDVSRPSDLMCLYYTGGTTGPSKGCMISHNYMFTVARKVVEYTDRRPDELIWNCMPLYHMNSSCSIVNSLLIGGSASIAPRFSVSGFWPEIKRTGARQTNLLGVMVPLLAQGPDSVEMKECFGQIRVIYAIPCAPQYEEIFKERFGVEFVMHSTYGLTECCPITYSMPNEQVPGGAGKCSEDFDVRIFDDDDHELPDGEVGEIVCRPLRPSVMQDGYWNRPEATAAASRNYWFHTGDLGHFDAAGNLFFDDRKKDYLRRGGENISSVEVELVFLAHPDVAEVAVHAVPSELSEDDLKVSAVLRDGATITEEELCVWAVDQLPYYAVPRYIEFRQSLPVSPLGRVMKYQLRDEGRTERTWDRTRSDVRVDRR